MPVFFSSETRNRKAAVFVVKDFRTGCCGEERVGFSSQPVLGKQLSMRYLPEQSNRNEGRRERGSGRGKLGTLVPCPQECGINPPQPSPI
jgi:hypothetical protein